MDLPAVFKSTLELPVAGFTVTIVQIEFSDHLMVLISRNGMIGDIVLSQKSNLPTVNGHVSHDLDTRTLFGPDKISKSNLTSVDEPVLLAFNLNTCLITRLITRILDTSKTILVSTDFKEDICFSDTQLICDVLKNIRST